MKLSDTAVRKAKPREKPYKLSDGRGMYLEVMPNGSKYWRLKYRFNGKEKKLALGIYPDVSLMLARERREEARKKLAQDVDPCEHKKAIKAAKAGLAGNSFEIVAREWFAQQAPSWAPGHSSKIIRRLERDLFPWIGGKPISEISAPELLAALRRIEARGALDTAHRAKENCGQIFRYAIATGRAVRDPSADLRGALQPVKGGHFAAITDPQKIGELLRAFDGYKGHFITRCALQLAPLVFLRPGELRRAEWKEINLELAEWSIPAERMKTRSPHLVPLSKQAVEILRELHPLTGNGRYVFPSPRSSDNKQPMSDNAILSAMRRLGFSKEEMSGHGFRAMARTILDEVLSVRPDYIEHQLAHAVKDPNGRAYNRTTHLPERRKMMQLWADYLDKLKAGAEVISLRA